MNVVNFKQNIYSSNKIGEILMKLGCNHVKIEQGGKLYTASLPNGNNPRSIQIKNNTYLDACIRSKGIQGIDIFDVVSYIKFDELSVDDMKYSRTMSINWVKRVLDIDIKEYSSSDFSWAKEEHQQPKNKVLNLNILNRYIQLPNKQWIEEGINYDTQLFFKIGYNLSCNQITIPIFNKNEELIGVKARNLDNSRYDEKYIYLYPCNARNNLFGLYIAKKFINDKKSIIIFEGEKSVMKAFQYGFRNTVALGCKDLTTTQLSLLKEYINNDTKIYLALDKDVYFSKDKYDYSHLKSIAKMFDKNEVYALIDKQSILGVKDAPIDKGKEAFSILLQKAQLVNTLIDDKDEDDDEW